LIEGKRNFNRRDAETPSYKKEEKEGEGENSFKLFSFLLLIYWASLRLCGSIRLPNLD
jgi:hypothetical protein